MEKISGILPASPRTRSAEVAAAQPARPGALSLGRPMGKNSLGDRVTLSKRMEELRQSGELPDPEPAAVYKNPMETKKLKIIEDFNKKFFSNPKTIARDDNDTQSEETLGRTTENESMFYVEKELRPEPPPLKQIEA